MDFNQLVQYIKDQIRKREFGETPASGDLLQSVLLEMANTLKGLSDIGASDLNFDSSKTYVGGQLFVYQGTFWQVKQGEEIQNVFDSSKAVDLIAQGAAAAQFREFEDYKSTITYSKEDKNKVVQELRLFKYVNDNPSVGEAPLVDGAVNTAFWQELATQLQNGSPWVNGVYKQFSLVEHNGNLYQLSVPTPNDGFVSADLSAELVEGKWKVIGDASLIHPKKIFVNESFQGTGIKGVVNKPFNSLALATVQFALGDTFICQSEVVIGNERLVTEPIARFELPSVYDALVQNGNPSIYDSEQLDLVIQGDGYIKNSSQNAFINLLDANLEHRLKISVSAFKGLTDISNTLVADAFDLSFGKVELQGTNAPFFQYIGATNTGLFRDTVLEVVDDEWVQAVINHGNGGNLHLKNVQVLGHQGDAAPIQLLEANWILEDVVISNKAAVPSLSYESVNTVVLTIEGINKLSGEVVNNGTGSVAFTGYGVLEVDGAVVYDGRASLPSSGGGSANYKDIGAADYSIIVTDTGKTFVNSGSSTRNLSLGFVSKPLDLFFIQGKISLTFPSGVNITLPDGSTVTNDTFIFETTKAYAIHRNGGAVFNWKIIEFGKGVDTVEVIQSNTITFDSSKGKYFGTKSAPRTGTITLYGTNGVTGGIAVVNYLNPTLDIVGDIEIQTGELAPNIHNKLYIERDSEGLYYLNITNNPNVVDLPDIPTNINLTEL